MMNRSLWGLFGRDESSQKTLLLSYSYTYSSLKEDFKFYELSDQWPSSVGMHQTWKFVE
jgi:hypothetical protein